MLRRNRAKEAGQIVLATAGILVCLSPILFVVWRISDSFFRWLP